MHGTWQFTYRTVYSSHLHKLSTAGNNMKPSHRVPRVWHQASKNSDRPAQQKRGGHAIFKGTCTHLREQEKGWAKEGEAGVPHTIFREAVHISESRKRGEQKKERQECMYPGISREQLLTFENRKWGINERGCRCMLIICMCTTMHTFCITLSNRYTTNQGWGRLAAC
jgi:hypothetical protein